MRPILVTLALLAVLAARSSGQVFTDRATFQAAVGSFSIEDFEDEALSGTTSGGASVSLTFSSFQVTTSPAAAKVLNTPSTGAFNTTPGGAKYLLLDTDIGNQGSAVTFNPPAPLYAFGFEYTDIDSASTTFTVMLNSQTYNPAHSPSSGAALFWGFVTTTPMTSVTVATSTDSSWGVDDVTFNSCAGTPSVTYGAGCAGSGGFVPILSGDGCVKVGGPLTLGVSQAVGGGTAFFFLGSGQASIPLGDCVFLLTPVLPPLFGLPMGGSGPGNGSTVLPTFVPATVPSGIVLTLQVLVSDVGVARGFSATNGYKLALNP